ncbi:hypothetical protein ACHHYP_20204 [Achlya hypogyna]|uniref:Uncharacterized protein n=1 Tax=Achlya hypogyna TaxID=1202772 RepID=A0A1V9YYH2_ACHHY|nr:hypothetical protein ACHHYP_20204 [Achlya hypogyna]
MPMADWDMEDVNEDLMGNPFSENEAFDAMVFPMSPLSKAGAKNLQLAQHHLRHEVLDKKRSRRCTMEIFQEQFADCTAESAVSTLLAMDDDDLELMVPFGSTKSRIPRLSPAGAKYFKKPDQKKLQIPRLPSKLVRPTQLKPPSTFVMKRPRVDDVLLPSKRLQKPAPVSFPSAKSRIPLRQLT